MTNPRQLWFVCAMLGLAAAASADVIGCPNHAEKEPDWRRPGVVSVSGSTLAARRAAEPVTHLLETAHFAIFYQTEGAHAVAGSGTDKDGNGHPDNIDSIGAIAERVWRLGVDTLGYLKPVSLDTTKIFKGVVPAGKFSIEILDLVTVVPDWAGQQYMGYAVRPSVENGRRQSLVIENDFIDSDKNQPIQVKVDPVNTNGTDSLLIDYSKDPVKGWKVAISHEFYHNLQYMYDPVYLYGFHEMTAVWFATRCYPSVKHHWQYYPGYLKNIHITAFETDGNGPYENFPFVTAMVGALGEGVLKDLWSVRQRTFTGDENVWIKTATDSLGIDLVPFTKLYVGSVLQTVANIPNLLNDDGKLKVNTLLKQLPAQRTGLVLGGAQVNGVNIYKLDKNQFEDGWNVLYLPTRSYSSGAFLRLPSGRAQTIHSAKDTVVVGKEAADTAWMIGTMNVMLDQYSASVDISFGQKSVNLYRKPILLPLAGPQFRMDLKGRPVQLGARGIVLEGSPATGWTRSVKMGE